MNQKPACVRDRRWAFPWTWSSILAAAIWIILGSGAVSAADAPRLLVSYERKTPPTAIEGDLQLRPNVEQPVFLAVECPANAQAKKVRVELWADGKPVDGAMCELDVNPGGKPQPVTFGKPMPAKDKEKPPAKEKEKKEWPAVTSFPFQFEIRLLEIQPNMALLHTVAVKEVMVPRQYVRVSSEYNGKDGTLTVTATPEAGFVGPKCPVELVLPADRLPGPVDLISKDKTLVRHIAKGDPPAKLSIDDLHFPSSDRRGTIYVNIDEFQRAYRITHQFRSGPNVPPDTGITVTDSEVRLNAAPFALPAKKFPFRFEVDYAPQQIGGKTGPGRDEVVLEVSIIARKKDKKEDIQFQAKMPRPGHRFQKLHFTPAGPEGTLTLRAEVRDWAMTDVDTSKFPEISGPRIVKISLLDRQSNKVIRWQGKDEQGRDKSYDLEDAKVVKFAKALPPLVVFGPNRPSKAAFGKRLVVQARAAVPEFKVSKVQVFTGEAENGKIPPRATEARLVPDQEGIWEAEVAMPEKGEMLPVNLVATGSFSDGEKLTSTDTINVKLEPPPTPRMLGDIAGKITIRDGDLAQGGAKVVLYSLDKDAKPPAEKEKEIKPTMSDEKGMYKFVDLKPGTYKIKCSKGKLKGEAEVTVEMDKVAKVDIDLLFNGFKYKK
jgi:hypothetical protein